MSFLKSIYKPSYFKWSFGAIGLWVLQYVINWLQLSAMAFVPLEHFCPLRLFAKFALYGSVMRASTHNF